MCNKLAFAVQVVLEGKVKILLNSQPILVRSKLLIPSLTNLLTRPRIVQAIQPGLERKLTIVVAPAGYGKTSVLVDFAQRCSLPVCWYTTDERDRDLGTFIWYLLGAIKTQFPDFGRDVQDLLTVQRHAFLRDPVVWVDELVNAILDVGEEFVVIVDNYEALDGTMGVKTFMHRLLEILPPNCHLILGSRVLPDVPVTRLVAKRQLVGLTSRDLRFTQEEIQELLTLSSVNVTEIQAQELAAHAEGWGTGILLLADLLCKDVEVDMPGRVTVDMYDYLAQEVLTRQPPDIVDFLSASSVLRECSVRLCREILHNEASRELLAEIERRHLFITRFGAGRGATYRYHNLFRDFLHERLSRDDPERHIAIHRRAAACFERDDDIEEAVFHYLAAQDYIDATRLMERVAMECFTRGRSETLLRWANALPRTSRDHAPRLALYQSRVLTDRYAYEQARQALAYAETGFIAQSNADGLARVHNQRATLALFEGQYEAVIEQAKIALAFLDQQEVVERAQAQRLIGLAHVKLGHMEEGVEQLQHTLAVFRHIGSVYDVANLLQDLAHTYTNLGRLNEAELLLNEALAIRRRLGAPVPLAGVLNNLGYLHYLRGKYQEALDLYEEGLAAARHGDDLRYQAYILVGLADLYRDVGAYERASPVYEAGWQMAQESEPGLTLNILASQAVMARWQGDYTQARILLAQADQLAKAKGLHVEEQGLLRVLRGIVLLEDQEVDAGLRLLAAGVRFLEKLDVKRDLAWAYFLQAKAYCLVGDERRAIAALRWAIALGNQIGAHQFIVVEGQYAEQVLALGIAEQIDSCRTILEDMQRLKNFGLEDRSGSLRTQSKPTAYLEIYTLGRGEIVRDGHKISTSEWGTATAKELFFYVLLHGPLDRDVIGVDLWPELSVKKMSNRFHIALHRVRKALGTDIVVVRNGQYHLGDVDYWLDVDEFESLVERSRLLPPHDWQAETLWRRAESLYQGDFLPDVENLWCVDKRIALREMYVETLMGIARCHEIRREYEEAVVWHRKALGVDEFREDIHRHIMDCYAKVGRRADALAQYDICREALRRDLGVEPGVKTKALYERIAEKPL